MAQELTFNISEDHRKLQGPVEAKNFNLKFGTDGVAITHGNPKQWVQGRIGDKELKQVFVNITEGENNTPKDVAGLFLAFVGIIHDKDGRPHRVVDYKHSTTIDVEHGRFRFDFPDQAFTVAGEYQQAFFMLVKEGPGGGCVATMEFDMQVMANFVFTDLVPEDYITPFNDTVDQLLAACKKFKDDTAADEAKFKQELEDAYAKFQKDTNTQLNNFKDATDEDLANFKKANADDIAKFKQQYADAVQAKKDELQSKVDSYTDKIDTMLKDLNQQGIDTTTLLNDLRSQMAELQDKIKQSDLVTKPQLDAFKQSVLGEANAYSEPGNNLLDKIINETNDRGINVRHYGAVGDGKTDNHDAILAAIKAAKDTGINHVYFPAGKYLTSNTDIAVEDLAITGDGRMSTTIISNQTAPLFSMKTNSTIRDLGFHSDLTVDNVIIGVNKRGDDAAYWNITLQNLRFDSMEYPDPTRNVTGHWTMRPFYFDLNGLGIWDVTVRDCSMQYVYAGLTIDTTNSGWMTGSVFDNLVVKGFTHHGFGIISSNNTSRQITQCVFTNLNVQVLYQTTGDDAAGYIISGVGNDYDNLRLLNDGHYTGHAIELRYFGGDKYDSKMPTFGYGATVMNKFKGGTLEGDIYDPDDIRELQHFDHVQLLIMGDNGSQQLVNVNDPLHENLLSKRGFAKNIIGDMQKDFPPDAKIMTGADQYGHFIDIEMTKTAGSFDYALSEPAATANALKKNDYSIGVRFQNMNPGSKVVMSGYLQFGGKDHNGNFNYWLENPSIQNKIQEYSWIYKADPDYFTSITSYSGDNSVKFWIPQATHIRIYGVYLCAGRAIDFNRVSDDSLINEGYGDVTGMFSGVSLNAITTQMIRYAGKYVITKDNQPADLPADLKVGEVILEVIPGRLGNQGVLKLFDMTNNKLWVTSVYNGNANGWIKLTA